ADRGLGIGLLVGALTVGSASPHLLKFVGGLGDWRSVLWAAAASALLGGVVAAIFIREGPFRSASPPFNLRYVRTIFLSRELMLANLGYLGHMWELFAMWTWIPAFLLASFAANGIDAKWASLVAFGVIAAGGPASVLAGVLADRLGRTTVTTIALVVSGTCALLSGQLFGGSPLLL